MRDAFGEEDGNYVGAEEDYRKWCRRYKNFREDSSNSSHDIVAFLDESPRWMVLRSLEETESTKSRPIPVPGGVYRTGYTLGSVLLIGALFSASPDDWEFYSGILTGLLVLIASSFQSFGVSHGYWPHDRYDLWEVLWTALLYPVGFACIGGLIFLLTGGCN